MSVENKCVYFFKMQNLDVHEEQDELLETFAYNLHSKWLMNFLKKQV